MQKLLALLSCLLLAGSASAQRMLPLGAGGTFTAGTPPSFTGPADIVASPLMWFGLRAMSTADRGNRLVNVCIPADATCADLSSDATTGALVISSIGGSSCSVVTCTVKTLYDRVGTYCGGSACNLTQPTIGLRPVLVVSCLSSLPCMQYTAAASGGLQTSGNLPGQGQPYTFSSVGNRTGNTSGFNTLVTVNGQISAGWANSTNTVYMYANMSLPTVTANDNTTHAMQMIYNDAATSSIYLDGANTTMTLGATTSMGAFPLEMGKNNAASQFLTGNIFEFGMWGSAFNGTQQSNMNGNQHTYWGF